MRYKIIQDEKRLQAFIEWLPDLEPHEKYFAALFARKKYCPDMIQKPDSMQLKRFASHKDKLFYKIKQLETEIGSYRLRDTAVPQESLVLYINPNPRDLKKATYNMIKKCTDILQNDNSYNIHAEALSCIQKSRGKSHFCDFDIDSKDIDLSKMEEILPPEAYNIVKTHGGYHILVNTRIAPKTKWHIDIRQAYQTDKVGDQMIPVCGCTQGGFIPHFVSKV